MVKLSYYQNNELKTMNNILRYHKNIFEKICYGFKETDPQVWMDVFCNNISPSGSQPSASFENSANFGLENSLYHA